MKESGAWNPYSIWQDQRMFPWLYPYGSRLNYVNLWERPEQMEDDADFERLQEMYPIMARRLKPYVEEVCSLLEYPGSMMYDEYPDQLSLRKKSMEIWERAEKGENFGKEPPDFAQVQDLIGVLLLQEMICRRKQNRRRYPAGKVIDTLSKR